MVNGVEEGRRFFEAVGPNLLDVIKRIASDTGTPLEALEALSGSREFDEYMRVLMALAHADFLAKNASFPVFATYDPLSYEELCRRFPRGRCTWYQQQSLLPFELYPGTPRVPRSIRCSFFHLGKGATTGEILDKILRGKMRPAVHEELLSFFATTDPKELFPFSVVALGSFGSRVPLNTTVVEGRTEQVFAGIRRYDYGDELRLHGPSRESGLWPASTRFLVVHEPASPPLSFDHPGL
jgi:hypothetical protein